MVPYPRLEYSENGLAVVQFRASFASGWAEPAVIPAAPVGSVVAANSATFGPHECTLSGTARRFILAPILTSSMPRTVGAPSTVRTPYELPNRRISERAPM